MLRIFFCIIFLLSSHILHAQYYRIEGKVIDGKTGMGLSNSNIELMSLRDTTYYSAESGIDGKFRIHGIKEAGKYLLMIHRVAYAKYLKVIDVSQNTSDLGKIKMLDSLVVLKESIIKAQRNGLVVKGDTLEYNAKSFKTNTDMDAVYFLSKLPGIDMSGNMKVDGDSVSKVMINGLICFGEKPKKMLENLPASVIEKIQIFNDLTDEERKTNSQTIINTKVINIVTKGDYFSKPRGKVYIGYAPESLHIIGGNILLQKKDEQLSLTAARNRGRIKNSNYFEPAQQFSSTGMPTENDIDFEWSKKIHPKVKINVDADYSDMSNKIYSSSITQYNTDKFDGRTIRSKKELKDFSKSGGFNVGMEYNVDSFIKFTLRGRQRANQSRTTNQEETNTISSNLNTRNIFDTQPFSNGHSVSESIEMTRIGKRRKSLLKVAFSLWYTGNKTDNITKGNTSAIDTFSYNFKSNTSNSNFTTQPELSYKLPFLKHHNISLIANWNRRINKSNQNQYNYSISDQDYTLSDDRILRSINNISNLQRFHTNYAFNRNKVKVEWNNSLQFFHLEGYNFKNLLVDKHYKFITTHLNVQYKLTPLTDATLSAERERNIPWIDDLNPILYNSNRVFMSIGNIDLQPTTNYNFFTSIKSKNKTSGSFFSLGTRYIYVPNPIRHNVLIADADTLYYKGIEILPGSQLRYTENVNPYHYFTQNMSYDFPLKWIRSIIKTRLWLTQMQNNSYINYKKVQTNTNTISPSITIASTISTKLDFTVYGSYHRTAVTQVQKRIVNEYKFNVFCVYEFMKNTFFKAEMNYNKLQGLSKTNVTSYKIINVSLERNLLKDGRLKLVFLAHDLLNSYSNFEFDNRVNYTVERYTNGIRRYFLGKINYTF